MDLTYDENHLRSSASSAAESFTEAAGAQAAAVYAASYRFPDQPSEWTSRLSRLPASPLPTTASSPRARHRRARSHDPVRLAQALEVGTAGAILGQPLAGEG